MWIRIWYLFDPGSGIRYGKIQVYDPGSGINIPDPQHCQIVQVIRWFSLSMHQL
jgi:hypothetical protein